MNLLRCGERLLLPFGAIFVGRFVLVGARWRTILGTDPNENMSRPNPFLVLFIVGLDLVVFSIDVTACDEELAMFVENRALTQLSDIHLSQTVLTLAAPPKMTLPVLDALFLSLFTLRQCGLVVLDT